MKRFFLLVVVALLPTHLVAAEASLWREGKDYPNERVNVGLKAVAPDVFLKISEKVDTAVVNVSTTKTVKAVGRPSIRMFPGPQHNPRGPDKGQPPSDDFFGPDFFGPLFPGPWNAPDQDSKTSSLGSGFIVSPDGYVVTNNHVIETADEIKVTLTDESEYVAKVVGRDPKTDVALLKIEPKRKLSSVILGDSSLLKVGDMVVAIGNPFGLSHSVTQGIVSAKERSIGFGNYDDFIQTDASINPGNSGGPLLNLQGEVVGINAAIVKSGQGIGFAIPINLAKNVLSQLKDKGKITRGWLGVLIQKVTEEHARALGLPERKGALVSDVQKKSPAEKAGIKAGDVIVVFDTHPIKDWHELPILVAETRVGRTVDVEVIRDKKKKTVPVEIRELVDESVEQTSSSQESKEDRLGLTVQKLNPEMAQSLGIEEGTEGVVVTEIKSSSSAYEKGVRRGDVILEVNRTKTPTYGAYRESVAKLKKGDSVLLLVRRAKSTLFIAFTL